MQGYLSHIFHVFRTAEYFVLYKIIHMSAGSEQGSHAAVGPYVRPFMAPRTVMDETESGHAT